MKRLCSFLIIFLITTSMSFPDSIINDIDIFSKLFPRPEGSSNNIETMSLISEKLDSFNVTHTAVNFEDTEGYHSFSTYIDADIPGLAEDAIISIIPIEGSYNIAAALSIIKYYSEKTPNLSLKFIFLGTEESTERYPGTRNFLEHYYPENTASFIYFNILSPPESIRIIPGADGVSTPFFLFEATSRALQAAEIAYSHSNTESILFRLQAAGTESMIKPYLSEGYPAIELTNGEPGKDNTDTFIDSDSWLRFFDNILDGFKDGLPSDWDSHYIFGIGEQPYLIILIVTLMILMIYPIFRRRHFGWYMQTLIKNLWILPLLFGLIFVFLSVSSILITLILNGIGFEQLWKYSPGIVFMFKISVSLLLYSLAFKLINKLPFSKRGSFYSISAIFFLVIELFILTMINLSLSFFALWPLFFIFLFTIFRKPVIKLLMLLSSVVVISFSLFEILTLPAIPALELITISPVLGDLLLALLLMPFILSAIRLDLLSPPSRRITGSLPLIFTAASVGLLFLILIYSPFSESNPQPVELTENIDANSDSKITSLTSPKEVDDLLSAQIISEIEGSSEEFYDIKVDIKDSSFLNRKTVLLNLGFTGAPEQVFVSLHSEEALTLYESNFPAEWLPSQNILKVFIGKNPSVPIKLSLTLNKSADINLDVEAEYPIETKLLNIDDNFFSVSLRKTIKKTYSDAD